MYSNQEFADVNITCADCGEQFVFTAEEQEFYSQKRYSSPKRCAVCRANRKLGDSNRRGGGGYGGGGYGGGRSSNYNKPQYEVICSACGVQTTVPFQPSEDKPVFCSQCYRNR